ncbi:CD1871A family CXXC motif-containing protein [Oscillospiraceae bacterium PP1C4]
MSDTAKRSWIAAAVLIAGLSFLVIGALRGEASTVLTKAIHICLECIGIG